MNNTPERSENPAAITRSARATSPFVDFFVWWGQELRGFFTGEDTGAKGSPKKALRILVGSRHISVMRQRADGRDKALFEESGASKQLHDSPKLAKALKRADSVELVAAAEIATLKSFRLPGSAGGTDADQLIEGIRSALPSDGGRLDVAVRVAPTDDNGSMLNFGFLPRSRLKPWFEAIQKYGVEGRFGGIDSETGLIAAVSPDGGAQLPARIGPEAPTPRGGVTVALVAGLIACTVLLMFALYQHREGYVAELSTKADAVGQDEAALIALEGEVTGLRQARVLLVASADIGPAGDVLDHMVALIPKTATLSRFVTDGHHVTLSGETRDRAALLKALSDDPAISGVTPVEPAEGESFIVELGIALVPDIAPASEIEGMP